MIVRRLQRADRDAVHAVHTAAFPANPDGGPVAEAKLVDDLYADGSVVAELSLVAEDASGEVVGHIMCSNASIGSASSLGLGPLGVRPDHQRAGVGMALMYGVLAAADALGAGSVVLLGDPRYYERFGFVLSHTLGVVPTVAEWQPHLQLRRLTGWRPVTGTFHYAPAFSRIPPIRGA